MQACMIFGGWDTYEGGQVCEIPLCGTIQQKFTLSGSGSTYIFSSLCSTYKENTTKEEWNTEPAMVNLQQNLLFENYF